MFITLYATPVMEWKLLLKKLESKSKTVLVQGLMTELKRKLQFEYDKAKEAIGAWKAHKMRAVNQDLAKQDILR